MSFQIDGGIIDRIKNGDMQALASAIDQISRGVNEISTRTSRLSVDSALTPIYCRLYRASSPQSIPDVTDTHLEWDAPTVPESLSGFAGVNVGGLFNENAPDIPGTPGVPSTFFPGRSYMKLTEPGLYLIEGRCRWDNNATGTRQMQIDASGLGTLDYILSRAGEPDQNTELTVQSVVPWRAVGDTWDGVIALQVRQDSGAARTVQSTLYNHYFAITRIAALR